MVPISHPERRGGTQSTFEPDTTRLYRSKGQIQGCKCCMRPKCSTSQDLSLLGRHLTTSLDSLRAAAGNDCQNCALILDALSTCIAPKTDLREAEITIRPFRLEGRLHIYIHPQRDSNVTYTELEILRNSDRLPDGFDNVLASGHRQVAWDLFTEIPSQVERNPRKTYRQISDWIDQCDKNHGSCPLVKITFLPKRVLLLTSDTVFVRENVSWQAPYACLSHCWGRKGPGLKLTKDTMDNLRKGTRIAYLPKTFRDAVRVCQSLQISFLWIDALCIQQDDLQDWKATAAHMASIYENAFVTLAATFAANSNVGLFATGQKAIPKQLRKHPDIYVRERRNMSQLPLTYRHFSTSDSSKHTRAFPLLYRAWVYQERRLSRRVVHFAQHQILWECKSCSLSEDKAVNTVWDSYVPNDSKDIHTQPSGYWSGDPVADWKKTISEFQGLQLTYESDRLPAIAALAERSMRSRPGTDTYIAGMWRNSILHELCWFHIGRAYERPQSTNPSWSWASIRGNVMWADTVPLSGAEVLDIQYTRIGPANIGEVIDASIRLKGHVIEGVYEFEPNAANRRTLPCGASMAISSIAPEHSFNVVTHFYPDFDFDLGTPPITIGDPITAIIIYKERMFRTGLILRHRGGKLDEYERIGLVSIQHRYWRTGLELSTRVKEEEQLDEYINSLPLKALKIV